MSQLHYDLHLSKLQKYERDVILKYHIYNGLFLGLPFIDPDQAGPRLAIFTKLCSDWMKEGKSVPEAVATYLATLPVPTSRHLGLLIKFLQFVERQVVLFDSLEDAAFYDINDVSGYGTLDYFLNQVTEQKTKLLPKLNELLESYKTRLVLTAHPTQFYPPVILDIITKLGKAISDSNINEIRNLFLQMGFSKFTNTKKPTPLDEAQSIIWYLESVFYIVVPEIQSKLSVKSHNLDIGFWPGGDRDGNPFVTANVTLEVAERLHESIINLYLKDLESLCERLTFDNVDERLNKIILKLKNKEYLSVEILIYDLEQLILIINENYLGLFVEQLEELILKITLFKFYFAKIDIRQNSAIHKKVVASIFAANQITANYILLTEEEQIDLMRQNWQSKQIANFNYNDELVKEVFDTFLAIYKIQQRNGREAIGRYIISNTDSAVSVIEVLWLMELVNTTLPIKQQICLEIIPLFETVEDLASSERIMYELFSMDHFAVNVKNFSNQQTIMLGFSDGTKDGGYLMANWAIFKAKKNLNKLARNFGINLTFFDGRGGPPSRGGGEMYSFYYSVAQEITAHEIQLTIQGQTISSNFGFPAAASFHIEHLLSAGLSGHLFANSGSVLTKEQEELIDELAKASLVYYLELKHDPLFVPYLEEITPLHYLAEANIGSRPAKRGTGQQLKLEDLRAIPFGASWMQMKQNILGYYGLGAAIQSIIKKNNGNQEKLIELYQNSLLFRGLIDNAVQTLLATNFEFTRHLGADPKFGEFWHKLNAEAELSKKMLKLISAQEHLVLDNPIKMLSINYREQIVLPLILIQQYAMDQLRHLDKDHSLYKVYEHLVRKSLAANINASRNAI